MWSLAGTEVAGWEGAAPCATAGTFSQRRPLLAAIALGKPSQCQALRAQALTGTWYSLVPPAPGKTFRKVHSHTRSDTQNYKYLQHPEEWEGSVNGRPAG